MKVIFASSILNPLGLKNAYYQKRIQQKFSIPTRIVYGTMMSFIKKVTAR